MQPRQVGGAKPTDAQLAAQVEAIRAEGLSIATQRARIEAEAERAAREVAEHEAEFEREFGTKDFAQVEAELDGRDARNLEKVSAYREAMEQERARVDQAVKAMNQANLG